MLLLSYFSHRRLVCALLNTTPGWMPAFLHALPCDDHRRRGGDRSRHIAVDQQASEECTAASARELAIPFTDLNTRKWNEEETSASPRRSNRVPHAIPEHTSTHKHEASKQASTRESEWMGEGDTQRAKEEERASVSGLRCRSSLHVALLLAGCCLFSSLLLLSCCCARLCSPLSFRSSCVSVSLVTRLRSSSPSLPPSPPLPNHQHVFFVVV